MIDDGNVYTVNPYKRLLIIINHIESHESEFVLNRIYITILNLHVHNYINR